MIHIMDDVLRKLTQENRPTVPWRKEPRPGHARQPLAPRPALLPEEQLTAARTSAYPRMYELLGAHVVELEGTPGVRFAVWAPNAREVSVVCNENHWNPSRTPLHGSSDGIWSGFCPGWQAGLIYKYAVRDAWGQITEKADPYAVHAEVRPRTASIVQDLRQLAWDDAEWMARRAETNWLERPVSIYEVHLGSWRRPKDGRRFFNYRELATALVEYCGDLGYTHIELLPISEHPFDGSWGYQTIGQFAATSRFGTPEDFAWFVNHCHQSGLGVIIDWVPAHFPTDVHGLARFDGTCLYEHEDPKQGFHPDWGTLVFNFCRHEVRNFLLSSARFWLDKYHVDGLRVDAVASMLYLDYSRKAGEWVPNCHGGRENLEAISLLKEMNSQVHGDFPGVLTIAEESTAWPGVSRPVYTGGLGFSMKWDMGWMNDTRRYMARDPVHRHFHLNDLSFRMVYAFNENFVLPLSHDEVVHGKHSLLTQMPGDPWQRFANLRLLYGYQYGMPGKKLLFMGGELAQWHEWQHDGELDWALRGQRFHDGMLSYIRDLNALYAAHPALYELDFDGEGFSWIQCDDTANCVFAFVRYARNKEDYIVCVFNFTPTPRHQYRLGVPAPGFYAELLNSDSGIYGGGNIGNLGGVYTEPKPMHGHAHSVVIGLPPLSMVVLQPRRGPVRKK